MGDNVLEGQVKSSRKRRDRAMTDMELPSLLNRPETVRRLFTVKPVEGAALQVGEAVLAIRTDGDLDIGVTRDYRRIGTIDGEGAQVLGRTLAETCGITTLIVREVSGVSGFGKAEITQDS
jgi:hypothetical protein